MLYTINQIFIRELIVTNKNEQGWAVSSTNLTIKSDRTSCCSISLSHPRKRESPPPVSSEGWQDVTTGTLCSSVCNHWFIRYPSRMAGRPYVNIIGYLSVTWRNNAITWCSRPRDLTRLSPRSTSVCHSLIFRPPALGPRRRALRGGVNIKHCKCTRELPDWRFSSDFYIGGSKTPLRIFMFYWFNDLRRRPNFLSGEVFRRAFGASDMPKRT